MSSRKKKILVLNYEFPPLGGGASPVSYEIAKRLEESGRYSIDVVTMGFRGLPQYEEITPNLHIHRVKCLRKKKEVCQPWEQATYLITGYFKSRELLKKERYDIAHCHFIIPTGVLALILKLQYKLPYIISAHGSDVPGYNPDRFTLLHRFTKPFLKIICNNSKKIISSSNYLKNLIKREVQGYSKEKLEVLPNGIDTQKFLPLRKKKIILSTGRLLPRKGFQQLIKAVSEQNFGYELHIAGDGPMMSELKKHAKNSKTKVVFHGWMDSTSKFYRELLGKAQIYCLVSEKENASVALLEAMSSGCAIITANTSGCAETVQESGIKVPIGNSVLLRKEIKKLIRNQKKMHYFQKQARKRAIETYSWKKIINKYEMLFD